MKPRHRTFPSINPAYAAFPLRIARSRIHRWGVFAAGPIPRGRKVIEYTGERIRWPEAYARLKKFLRPRTPKTLYMFRLNRLWRIDGAVGGSGAERINHSCDPNLRVRRIRGHILFFSRRRIRPGEELSLDYCLHPKTFRIPCRCGSPNCRGFLNRE
jgi:SET domain-containing protein